MNPPKESIDFSSKWKGEKVLFWGEIWYTVSFTFIHFFRIIESDDIIIAEILNIIYQIDYASYS